jgi:hypothetical protein
MATKETPMFYLTYVSSATELFSQQQLRDLLAVSIRNNRRIDITGMLLYKDGNFMQTLEGEESVVRQIYDKLQSDTRHHGLITLLSGPLAQRHFPDWSMGFRDLASSSVHTEGYNEFLNAPLTGSEFADRPSRAQKLLLSFKKSMLQAGIA